MSRAPQETSHSRLLQQEITPREFYIETIADYGGGQRPDHAFNEVASHFYKFRDKRTSITVKDHPVSAYSTIETGYWIA